MGLGNNAYGQLGNGSTTDSLVPVAVKNLKDVTAIAAGSMHSAALVGLGRVRVWGDNSYAQLGVPALWYAAHPVAAGPDSLPASVGNVLLAVRQGADVLLEFGDASGKSFRMYRDGDKLALGTTALGADLTTTDDIDAGALGRGGIDFYVVRGLSACSSTPGP